MELRGIESFKRAVCIGSMYVLLTGAVRCTGVTIERDTSAAHHTWKLYLQVFFIEAVAYLIDGHRCWAFGKANDLNRVGKTLNLFHASWFMTRNITIQRYHAQSLFRPVRERLLPNQALFLYSYLITCEIDEVQTASLLAKLNVRPTMNFTASFAE